MNRETLAVDLRSGFLAGLALAGSGLAAAAQDNAFYKDKKLTFLINFTPGGPTDFEGRLVARHIAKHIPGAPVIIPRNMPGAGGIVGLNWLGKVAPHDGTVVGFLTGAASKATMGDPGVKVDLLKMGFIASGPGTSVAYIRSDVAPGIKTPADILKASGFWAAGLSPESDKDVRIRMQLDMLGLKYKYISGYRGSAETRLALQRGEIHMTAESMPTYRASIEPGLIKPGTAIPLWYDPFDDGKTFSTPAEAKGIPAQTFTSFYKSMKGEPPKGLMWDSFRIINKVGTLFLRMMLVPSGTPPEAIAALKQGLVKMQQDRAFKAESLKSIQYVPRYETGADMEAIFRKTIAPPKEIRAFFRSYIENGKSANGRK